MNLEKDAKEKFLRGDYLSVENEFKKNGYFLEYAYCRLLDEDLDEARYEFKKLADKDLRADWGLKLIDCINLYVPNAPSYFQIRNFLEIDLHFLIMAGRAQYVENIINCADLFFTINPESYKFIARVLIFHDFDDVAMIFLQRAKDKFYTDPELHYMLASLYLKTYEDLKAKSSLRDCLRILPNYVPAKKMLEKLSA